MSWVPELAGSIHDAHVHLWDTSRFELPWLAAVPELAPRYTAADLRAAIGDVPVGGAVTVQAGESAAEAAWLMGETDARSTRVVLQYAPSASGWLGAVHPVVDQLRRLPAGVRLPVHRRAADWTDLEGLGALLAEMEKRGLVLELLLRPDQLAVVDELAARHPRLPVVLCHLGLATAAPTPDWRASLARLARRATVRAKVSGLFSSPGTAGGDAPRVRDAVSAAMDALGPRRLMFGSDWPMSTRVGPYAEVVERTALSFPELSRDEATAIWRRNAEDVYGWGEQAENSR